MSCFQVLREGLPDRETIIIILIRTCPTLFAKNAFDSHLKVNDVERDIYPKEDKGMSEIVIRHAETRDYEAIRQIHAQPEVYCNTLQVPHPSDHMWQERLADRPASSNSSPVLMETSWAISPLTCNSAHAAVMLPILVSVSTLVGRTAASPAP